MKISLLLLLSLLMPSTLLADDDPSNNTYKCELFQPDSSGGSFTHARVTESDPIAIVQLNDGIHYVEIHWWHWILNVSVHKKDRVPEVVGGASHTQIKLRVHDPKVSIRCERE